jgi:hypothetical protein
MAAFDWTDAAAAAVALGPALARMIQAWVDAGKTSAIQALKDVCDEPEVLRALDEALIVSERNRAAAELPP